MSAGLVVVGGGQAGFQVAASLREAGFVDPVTIVGDEPGLPYQRPPLSKAYLAGKADAEGLRLRPDAYFAEHRIAVRSGTRAVAIDREARTLRLGDGSDLAYDHLVLATGARNRPLPVPGADLPGVR
ncbi:FAD-dependent oxidoreductase, partial [Methylobacterium sp. WL120]|uniref:FAD-dependent oxidoreductase n=1 Tax=Methylobacterium sp. WL120 TaxID=2603887 RepID=UPI0011DC5F9F